MTFTFTFRFGIFTRGSEHSEVFNINVFFVKKIFFIYILNNVEDI